MRREDLLLIFQRGIIDDDVTLTQRRKQEGAKKILYQ